MTPTRPAASRALRAFLLAASLAAMPHAAPVLAQTSPELDAKYDQAEALRLGKGVAKDLTAARSLHEELAAAGVVRSLPRLAVIYRDAGDFARAITTLEDAVEQGSFYARIVLAQNHANGEFGPLSTPEAGFAELKAMAETSDNKLVKYQYALAVENGAGTEAAPQQALFLYQELADSGHTLSMARLASKNLGGSGVPADARKALEYYQAAVDGGYDYGLIGLARTQMELGLGKEALASLEKARELGFEVAETRLAIGHLNGDFGTASRKVHGERELRRLAEAGNIEAGRIALIRHERKSRRISGLDLNKVLGHMNDAMEQGDGGATEALARAYRRLTWLIPRARDKHNALVENYGHQLRTRSQSSEQVSAIYDRSSHRVSMREAYECLERVEGQGFTSGMIRLWQLERTAFVYALQKELRKLELYSGPATGKMTRSTVLAVFRFCRQEEIYDNCKHGPLRYQAITEIADALSYRRAPVN